MGHVSGSIRALIDGIIKVEGDYSNHPADRGGPTRFGVTEAVARDHGYLGDMRALPVEKARDIYLFRYYEKPGFDRVAELSPAIAHELTDTGVNMGVVTAIRFLQRALNVLNQRGEIYPDQGEDGRIGPELLEALQRFLRRRGEAGEKVLLTALNCQQGARYIELARANSDQEAFVYGWLANRVVLPTGAAA